MLWNNKKSLNLDNIEGLSELSDAQAESISAGAFSWDTGYEYGFTEDSVETISLQNATKLGLKNADPGASVLPGHGGHHFHVYFVDRNNNVLDNYHLDWGDQIVDETVQTLVANGATHVHVRQYCDCL